MHHSSEEDTSDDVQTYTESESEGTEYSDDDSSHISDTTSAGLRRKLHRYIQREKERGEGFNEIVNRLVAQERLLAKLEIRQSAQSPGESF